MTVRYEYYIRFVRATHNVWYRPRYMKFGKTNSISCITVGRMWIEWGKIKR